MPEPQLTASATTNAPFSAATDAHEHHRDIQGGGARAAIFGTSDGLLTSVSLILGLAGAHTSAGLVRLAGLASLVAGAFSMATGEYVSMSAHSELLKRELEIERFALKSRPEEERLELAALYQQRGLAAEEAEFLATKIMQDPKVALEVHAREELGVDPNQTGAPVLAAVLSFICFIVGGMIPLLPWFFVTNNAAILTSIILGVVMAFGLGWGLASFTGRSHWFSAVRQLGIAIIAAAVTYQIGSIAGVKVA